MDTTNSYNHIFAEIHAMLGVCIKRLVKMGKHIRKFQSLTQEDQIMLLKGGVVEVNIFLTLC